MRLLMAGFLCLVASGALGQVRTPPPTGGPGAPPSSLVELNSASRDDLMTLEGIGEVRADAIIRARPFRLKTELVERRLIPEALYEKIGDKVVVRPAAGTPPTPGVRPAPPPPPAGAPAPRR